MDDTKGFTGARSRIKGTLGITGIYKCTTA